MTDLNELQIFVHVARTRSFTAAAKRLELPKSTVSRCLNRLETRLGIQLVERTTRRVALTEEGRIYFDRCEHLLEEAEQADLEIGALQAKPRGTLRVGAPGIFARSVLGPALAEFLAMHRDLRVHLHLLEAGSREKPMDVIIRPGPLEDSGFLVKPLFKIRIALYASPSYLQGRSIPDSPAALREHNCIITSCAELSDGGDAAVWRLRRGLEMKEIRVESRVRVPDPAITRHLAVAGVGVALLSRAAAGRDVESGRLVHLLPDWEPDPVKLHALYASRLASSPKVRTFVQFLKERFSGDFWESAAPTLPGIARSRSAAAIAVARASLD